jgi:O-antigen/teichoic acid export membrane protein
VPFTSDVAPTVLTDAATGRAKCQASVAWADPLIGSRSLIARSAKAAAATSVAALSAAGVAFLVNILMARLLGPGARGEVAWVLQVAYVAAPALALGFDRSALRGEASRSWRFLVHIWVLGAVFSIGSAAIFGQHVAVAFLIASAGAFLAVERGMGMWANRLGRYLILQVAFQAWTGVASVLLFLFSVHDVDAWLAVYAVPAIFFFLLWLLSAFKQRLRLEPEIGNYDWWRTYLRNIRYVPGGISAILAGRVERLLLPFLASSAALGLYVSVATASEILLWVAQGISESKVGREVSSNISRGTVLRVALRDMLLFSIAGVVLAGVLKVTLIPALGASFAAAGVLVFPLCMASAAWATYRQVAASWIARATPTQTSVLEGTAAVLTATCAIIAIPRWGALGAALACLVAYTTMVAVSVVSWPRESVATVLSPIESG